MKMLTLMTVNNTNNKVNACTQAVWFAIMYK